MSIFDKVKDALVGFWHDDFEPWFKTLLSSAVHAEVAALLPIASSAAGAMAANLATNSGNMSAFADTAAAILKNTAAQAEAASIQAGGASLLLAVNTAIANHTAAVPLGGTPTPALPPAAPPPSSPPRDADGLRLDGPTLKEYVEAGYKEESYPPQGYAKREAAEPAV